MSDYDNKDDATHMAKYIEYSPDIKITGVETKNLFKHAELCKYKIYELTVKFRDEDDDEPYIVYGILESDFKRCWRIALYNIITGLSYEDSVDRYIQIDEKTLKYARKYKPTGERTGIETYFLQRTLWGDDEEIINRPVKKIEYEAGYQLFIRLSNRMTMTHQKNFLNKRVDMVFELRNCLDVDIPAIGVEINEDGHKQYNKEEEKSRAEMIKYFDNILYTIDLPRGSSVEEIKKAVEETAQNIMRKADDMLIVYNPEISPRQLEEELLKHDYSTQVVSQFLANHNTGDRVFCLRHDIVGEYLGYSKSDTYRRFKEVITGTKTKPSKFKCNIDYKIVSLKSLLRCSKIPVTENSIKNKGGKDSQTQIIIFPITTYNKLCNISRKSKSIEISDFFKMYETLFKYIKALRRNIVIQNRENKAREPVVKARVDEIVDQRVKMYKVDELSKELLDTQRKNVELKDKISSDAIKMREYEETIKDLLGKISAHEIMYQELKDKSETKMKENNDTIKDLIRKVDYMVLMSAQLEESKLKCKKLVKSNKVLRENIIKLEKKSNDDESEEESLKNTKDEKKSNKEYEESDSEESDSEESDSEESDSEESEED